MPNARPELLPEAGAQRTLEAVSSRPLFGSVPDAAVDWSSSALEHPQSPFRARG
jgi:hypothetical protein